MTSPSLRVLPADPVRANPDLFVERAFSRMTGSILRRRNGLRLLRDGEENYAAWLAAIASATERIHFENYIIADDEVGMRFAEALKERAQAGVRVRLLYDWFGSLRVASSGFWRDLKEAGVEVRAFNTPRISAPLGWTHRNHRKVATVDGRIAFVSGLCVARAWSGLPAEGVLPWRDTGVELEGPAVADVENAFAQTWALAGPPVPDHDLRLPDAGEPAGDVTLRVIASQPGQLSIYRLDQLVAAAARQTLWLTDAYFVATNAYVRALTEAARDGVDVRLLVPGSSDVPPVQALVRTNYRALLETGVHIFEWNGSMLHAKTAVADGEWARIGSTNLNLTSWMGNWELDVTVEDRGFAGEMQQMYLADLENATEIAIDPRRRVRSIIPPDLPRSERPRKQKRVLASALGLGSAAGAAITDVRPLAATEARTVAILAAVLVALASLAIFLPLVLTVPLAVAFVWTAIGMLVRSWRLWRARLLG